MQDIHTQIQDAIVARLIDQIPEVYGRVHKVVDAPFRPEDLPALVVTMGSENIETYAGESGHRLEKRDIQIVVDAIENSEATTAVQIVRDLKTEVETALGDFEQLEIPYSGSGRHALKDLAKHSNAPNGDATEEGRVEVQSIPPNA